MRHETPTTSPEPTAHEHAESRLRESEQRFRLAMANAPIGMALIGLDGTWLETNRRVSEIVGRSPEELRGLTFQDITHPEDLDADLAHVEQLLAGDIDWYAMEKRYIHADGRVVWILLSGSLVRGDDGEPRYFIAQIQDITRRKHAEAELHRLNEELARSNAELQRFAAVASHDLRSPLATVHAVLDLVVMRYGDTLDDDVRDWLQRARRHTTALAESVDALLDLARVGRDQVATEPVDTGALVAEVAETLAPDIEEAGAQLQVGDLPTVDGDRAQLRLLFQNLVANALKFRDPDRPLVVAIDATRADGWVFRVTDNGRGFGPADREVIFEPFARTHTGEKVAGSGIGLATCRRIVQHHGGTIEAEPLDPGARLVFTLPADPGSEDGVRHP